MAPSPIAVPPPARSAMLVWSSAVCSTDGSSARQCHSSQYSSPMNWSWSGITYCAARVRAEKEIPLSLLPSTWGTVESGFLTSRTETTPNSVYQLNLYSRYCFDCQPSQCLCCSSSLSWHIQGNSRNETFTHRLICHGKLTVWALIVVESFSLIHVLICDV